MAADSVDFNRDIRPIFAAKCFACHGPDEEHREAGLRLDVREDAIEYGAIEPGYADDSEFIRRILSEDPDEVMPPAHTGDVLTEEQTELFVRWVNEGAKYAKHWSFVPPVKPPLPDVEQTDWPLNEIDFFVLARLEAEGMSPSPPAEPYALVRRVYLDLVGLPPTPEQADAFANDNDPEAYEKLVDQLLKSKHYGERWARLWLDLARYSDTNGYEKDRERSIWPYRDWVIRALNDDMPFDQFTIEQLAGDMLDNPTHEQLIATGFHRNTMLNEEGGIDPLEYRFYAMVDRVATTGSVWMGLSTGCAQCHTHKYDPITHTDYYRLMALMNNADEPDMVVETEGVVKRRDELLAEIQRLESELVAQFPAADGEGSIDQRRKESFDVAYQAWLVETRKSAQPWQTMVPTNWETNLPRLEVLDDGSMFATGDTTKRDVFELTFQITEAQLPLTAIRLEAIADSRLPDGGPGNAYYEGRKGTYFLSEMDATLNGQAIEFSSTSQSNVDKSDKSARAVLDGNGSSGWSGPVGETHQLVLQLDKPITEPGELRVEMLFERHFVASLGRFRFSCISAENAVASTLPVELEALLTEKPESLNEQQNEMLLAYYLSVAPELAEARKPIDALRKKLPSMPTTMVLRERPEDNPRQTFRHHRGEFLSPKEEVTPGIPTFLADDPSVEMPTNRLELARWLVSDANPLVARVAVNRAWQAMFGTGLQSSNDDFGTQAEPPSNPELLDWLACEFVDRGWSMKSLHRLIVTSATYRQSSRITPTLLQHDTNNELLARGPRFRVDAEMVRDIMLSSSGLLSTKMYGPGIYPPQPQSVTAAAYGSPKWNASSGDDRYRRSIYTFSKRTAPFAAFSVFNAPSGENCVARRERSNTPLQALTLLNDDMYLEMAKSLAIQATERHSKPTEIATFVFRRLCIRTPDDRELSAIIDFFQTQLSRLEAGELSAAEINGNETSSNSQAAWTIVARSLMNLDEVITKP